MSERSANEVLEPETNRDGARATIPGDGGAGVVDGGRGARVAPTSTSTSTSTSTAAAPEPGIDLAWLGERIDYRRFTECVHCGLCLGSCPTFVMTGDENDGPRGRIYLMRSIVDGEIGLTEPVRRHLDLCLDCRACETACPSGVKYSHMIEPFHIAMAASAPPAHRPGLLQRLILRHLFPYPSRVRPALIPARIAQRLGLLDAAERLGLTRLLPATLRRLTAMLPRLEPSSPTREVYPPVGPKRATVALLTGCVADPLKPGTTRNTIDALRHNGCEVHVPRDQRCCGAIDYHSGAEEPALRLARRNLEIFDPARFDAIIVNAAGCGAMFKDYAHILPESDRARAEAFVAKVRDVHEFLVELGPIRPTRELRMKVTYHDACHLCHGQQIRNQPRALLAMIPGLELAPLEETEICCGAAGTYNLTQPEMSEALGRRKMEFIEATGADAVATGNIGCILQIERKAKEFRSSTRVVHPIDLLAESYGPIDDDRRSRN